MRGEKGANGQRQEESAPKDLPKVVLYSAKIILQTIGLPQDARAAPIQYAVLSRGDE